MWKQRRGLLHPNSGVKFFWEEKESHEIAQEDPARIFHWEGTAQNQAFLKIAGGREGEKKGARAHQGRLDGLAGGKAKREGNNFTSLHGKWERGPRKRGGVSVIFVKSILPATMRGGLRG